MKYVIGGAVGTAASVAGADLVADSLERIADVFTGNPSSRGYDSGVAYAAELPQDKYDPRGDDVSEANFKNTIARDSANGLVWVMYDWGGVSSGLRQRGDEFWDMLKEKYGTQVDAFIRINVDGWSNNAAAANKEITKDAYPAFILYSNGRVVNDGTNDDIRIRGPPN